MANNEKVNKAFALYKKGKKLKDITKGWKKMEKIYYLILKKNLFAV